MFPAGWCVVILPLLLALSFAPAVALAWGSATHAYLAKRALGGNADGTLLYGAAAPDIFETSGETSSYGAASGQTHYSPMKLLLWAGPQGLGPFALGFISHNNVRGADYYAHRRGTTTRDGYVIAKSLRLKTAMQDALATILARAGIPAASLIASQFAGDFAHSVVETAIDVLVCQRDDPGIAAEFLSGATNRPPAVPLLLARSFGFAIAEKTGMPRHDVDDLIVASEEAFRRSIIGYAEALSAEEADAVRGLAEQGAEIINAVALGKIGQHIGVTADDLIPLVYLAMAEVEGDYRTELDNVTVRLRGYLKVWGALLKR
jgi:hypothetical protein